MVESCGQASRVSPLDATVTAIPTPRPGSASRQIGRGVQRTEENAAIQIGFRRALTVGCWLWMTFIGIDILVVRYLDAGSMSHFLALRFAVLVVVGLVLLRMRRPASERVLTAADLAVYCSSAVGLALMCVEFRGLCSPYIPGFCIGMFSRIVASQDPWKARACHERHPRLALLPGAPRLRGDLSARRGAAPRPGPRSRR